METLDIRKGLRQTEAQVEEQRIFSQGKRRSKRLTTVVIAPRIVYLHLATSI